MLGKFCPWLNILVMLCTAQCQSCAGDTWQGLGRGLEMSCVGGCDPHVPYKNGPNWLPYQQEQPCSPSGDPWPWHIIFKKEPQTLWGGDYEETGEEKWMAHCWGHGWRHSWRHTLGRMCSLPEEWSFLDHGCGQPTLWRGYSWGIAATGNLDWARGKQGRSHEQWSKMKQRVAEIYYATHSPKLLLWPLPHQRDWERLRVTSSKSSERRGERDVGL